MNRVMNAKSNLNLSKNNQLSRGLKAHLLPWLRIQLPGIALWPEWEGILPCSRAITSCLCSLFSLSQRTRHSSAYCMPVYRCLLALLHQLSVVLFATNLGPKDMPRSHNFHRVWHCLCCCYLCFRQVTFT